MFRNTRPQRGGPASLWRADNVPKAIGKCISNASVYHIVSCFLIFTGAIADIHNSILKKRADCQV